MDGARVEPPAASLPAPQGFNPTHDHEVTMSDAASAPALLEWGTKVRMKAGIATTGKVVGCWHTHPNTERMVALHGAWVAENLAYPVAKVAWDDGEVTFERVADLVGVPVPSLWDKSA